MRLSVLGLGLACVGAAGCATTPPPATSHVAVILWPRSDAGCDFENPDRGIALAINTDRTDASVVDHRSDEQASATYRVRSAQILYRPVAGDRFCLTVLRGPTLGHKDAVSGFDVRFVESSRAEIAPAYARLDRPLFRQRGSGEVKVGIALVAGRQSAGGRQTFGHVSFDLGPVGRGANQRSGAPLILDLPEPGPRETVTLGAVIREAGEDQSPVIPADLIDRALTDRAGWD
ncbi:hypothetical protein [Brevundimonas sp. GCM10030266]|uniref:hypothetical protein n=1 Tax=Brevundimonas sp. GCM10030266 TaxID=3273386 RepID=UPI00361B9CFB